MPCCHCKSKRTPAEGSLDPPAGTASLYTEAMMLATELLKIINKGINIVLFLLLALLTLLPLLL